MHRHKATRINTCMDQRHTVLMNRTGKVALSTSCWIAAAKISEGNKSVNPKQMSIAGNGGQFRDTP